MMVSKKRILQYSNPVLTLPPINTVACLGQGCYMSKLDIKNAFRLIPIRPSQWPLMGTTWLKYYFVDTQLPFGLRSSPGIFNRFADAVCWIIQELFGLPHTLHYSDNFFLVATNYETALNNFNIAEYAFKHLGILLAEDKKTGPSTKITY